MKLRPVLFTLALSSAALIAQPPVGAPGDLQTALMNLANQPATHSSFSLDRAELQTAQNLLASNGLDANRAAAAITGFSVDNYHYPRPAFYTPETMASIIAGYHAAGWKHLVNANQTPATTAQPHSTVTDLWLRFAGPDITGITVLNPLPPRHERRPDRLRTSPPRSRPPQRPLRHPQGRPQRRHGPRPQRQIVHWQQ